MQVFGGGNRKRKEEIIEQVVLERYNQYYRLAYSYVRSEADACDIVQNGAYKALRNSGTLRCPEYAGTWVYRIMLNEIFNFLNQPQFESYEHLQEENGRAAEGRADHYRDVDLQNALNSLPAKEKAVIMMKYFEDKKLEEIAEILNENLSTVKSRLYRSMNKLRIKLSAE